MPHYIVECDLETAERVGAVGTFQVTSLVDDEGVDRTHLLHDLGKHYFSFDQLRADIADATGLPISQIAVESG